MRKLLIAAMCCASWTAAANAAIVWTDDVDFQGTVGANAGGPGGFGGGVGGGTANITGGLTIILNNTGGVEAGTQARAGFEAAAAIWSSILRDPVTIRLDVG